MRFQFPATLHDGLFANVANDSGITVACGRAWCRCIE
jgi:hypothetical protein